MNYNIKQSNEITQFILINLTLQIFPFLLQCKFVQRLESDANHSCNNHSLGTRPSSIVGVLQLYKKHTMNLFSTEYKFKHDIYVM